VAKRLAAVDSSVLLALADGDEVAEASVDWLLGANIYPVVTPTVLQELELARSLPAIGLQPLAEAALRNIPVWGFFAPNLSSIDHGIAGVTGRKLIEKVIDGAGEENDGLVLAEAAVSDCVLLLTYRRCLLDCSTDRLRLCFVEGDLKDTFVVSPDDIVEYAATQEKKAHKEGEE
jgi:hypothetical protein